MAAEGDMRACVIVGQELDVVVSSPCGGEQWDVLCDQLPPGWTGVLRSRSRRPLTEGDRIHAWVFWTDKEGMIAFFSDSDFGRMPISDRMRPRYVQALRHVIQLLESPPPPIVPVPDLVSEAKGLFNRCAREDQWDWFTVHEALGYLDKGKLRSIAGGLAGLSRAARQKDDAAIQQHLARLRSFSLVPLLQQALRTIEEGTPSLPNARRLTPTDVQKVKEVPGTADSPVLSIYSKRKLDEANEAHRRVLQLLVGFLEAHGHRVEENRHVDAFCHLKSGPAIFEVKSITPENELGQSRQALSQLYEYLFRHNVPNASLWIAFSKRPEQSWIVDYLINDRGLCVIWLEGKDFSGPSVDRLTESGITAMKRQLDAE